MARISELRNVTALGFQPQYRDESYLSAPVV